MNIKKYETYNESVESTNYIDDFLKICDIITDNIEGLKIVKRVNYKLGIINDGIQFLDVSPIKSGELVEDRGIVSKQVISHEVKSYKRAALEVKITIKEPGYTMASIPMNHTIEALNFEADRLDDILKIYSLIKQLNIKYKEIYTIGFNEENDYKGYLINLYIKKK